MHQGIDHQIRQLAERQGERFLDLAVVLRRKKTGETLLCAGGQWDQIEQRYTGRTPSSARTINIVESQVPLVRWFGPYLDDLAAGRERDISLGLAIGNRRAGKTVGTMGCAVAATVRVPRIGWHGMITWAVGVTRPEMQELDRYLRWLIPAAWYQYRAQEHIYRLVTGAEIHAISADDPRTLKRGEANLIVLNEAQKMPVAVLSNAIMGAVDHGGLTLLAANQPEDKRGEWVARLQRGVRSGQIPATVVFPMDVKDNDEVDQSAHSRGAAILEQLDPEGYKRDILNQDILQEGKALPHFDPQVHVRSRREQVGLVNITADLTYRRIGRPYRKVIGQDYQGWPYMPAVVVEAWGTEALQRHLRGELDAAQLDPERDVPYYWIVDEVIVSNCTEHELCDQMWIAGLRPETAYCVGDASGTWQNAHHKVGDTSFDIVGSRRWHVVPAFSVRTDREDAKPQNPRVKYRVNLARWLCGIPPEAAQQRGLSGPVAPRWFIEPHCTFGIKALQECDLRPAKKAKEMVPGGSFAHYYDAATYVLCHLEPRPEEQGLTGELPDNLLEVMGQLAKRRSAAPI